MGTMLLDSKQAAVKLGLTISQFKRLLKKGLIPTFNKPEGGHRFHARFDSRVITALRKGGTLPVSGRPAPTRAAELETNGANSPATDGIFTRLDRLEAKIDRLLAIWS